jgi:hypothetical protein
MIHVDCFAAPFAGVEGTPHRSTHKNVPRIAAEAGRRPSGQFAFAFSVGDDHLAEQNDEGFAHRAIIP